MLCATFDADLFAYGTSFRRIDMGEDGALFAVKLDPPEVYRLPLEKRKRVRLGFRPSQLSVRKLKKQAYFGHKKRPIATPC